MMLELLYPIFFFLLFFIAIKSKYFFNSYTISKKLLIFGFSIKALSAIVYGYLFISRALSGGDTFMYIDDANIVYSALKTNPYIYLKLLFGYNDFKPVPSLLLPYTDAMGFWFDSSNYFVVRVNAFIRLFSFGIYNVHAVIFAFLSFIGTYNIYLFFVKKVRNVNLLQFILFGLPSIVFWTSGVHKEALVIFALGMILYNVNFVLKNEHTKRHLLFTFIGLFILGYIRIYLLAFLFPLIAAIFLYTKFDRKQSTISVFFATGIISVLVVGLIIFLFPNISFIHEFFVRRTYFLNSPGNYTFNVASIPHNFGSLFILLWEAISNPFIRPLPAECNSVLPFLASFETIIIFALILILLFSVKIKSLLSNPYALFCILYSLSTLFLIGLIVNNSGAIVRYRSIAIPFLLIAFILKNKEENSLSHQSVKYA